MTVSALESTLNETEHHTYVVQKNVSSEMCRQLHILHSRIDSALESK